MHVLHVPLHLSRDETDMRTYEGMKASIREELICDYCQQYHMSFLQQFFLRRRLIRVISYV